MAIYSYMVVSRTSTTDCNLRVKGAIMVRNHKPSVIFSTHSRNLSYINCLAWTLSVDQFISYDINDPVYFVQNCQHK